MTVDEMQAECHKVTDDSEIASMNWRQVQRYARGDMGAFQWYRLHNDAVKRCGDLFVHGIKNGIQHETPVYLREL